MSNITLKCRQNWIKKTLHFIITLNRVLILSREDFLLFASNINAGLSLHNSLIIFNHQLWSPFRNFPVATHFRLRYATLPVLLFSWPNTYVLCIFFSLLFNKFSKNNVTDKLTISLLPHLYAQYITLNCIIINEIELDFYQNTHQKNILLLCVCFVTCTVNTVLCLISVYIL